MIVLKKIFHKVGPKTKSRRKVIHDIKKVEKHCIKVSHNFTTFDFQTATSFYDWIFGTDYEFGIIFGL